MKKNQNLIIEIGVHLDLRDSDMKSIKLDKLRAEEILSYFVSMGINKKRLYAKGYGKSNPIITLNKIMNLKSKKEVNAAHAKNRRTEFKIINL